MNEEQPFDPGYDFENQNNMYENDNNPLRNDYGQF